jgi:hypothetical protein
VLSIKGFLNMELYLRTLTAVKICILQCAILMFRKRVLSDIWGNIFVIYLERKDVEFYVGFNWLRIVLLGCVCEKADKCFVLIKAYCNKAPLGRKMFVRNWY